MIKVSFIIPAFNAEATIISCLNSVLAQTTVSYEQEIICIDNCSTDNTYQLLTQFKDSILVIKESKQSRSHARQAGTNASSGEFIVFVDSDTTLDSDWTEKNLKLMLSKPQVGATQSKIEPVIEKRWQTIQWNHTRYRTFGTFHLLSIVGTSIIPVIDTAASMWRREAIKSGFNTNLNRAEDVDLTMRVLYAGYSLAGGVNTSAQVRWSSGLFSWFKRFYEQASSEKYVYTFWGCDPRPVIIKNIFSHPYWGSLSLPTQLAEVILTFLHSLGFKKSIKELVMTPKPELKDQNHFCVTFKNDSYYLGENIRSIFFNDYIALINLKTFKCYWVYEDEMKWTEKMEAQLLKSQVIIKR